MSLQNLLKIGQLDMHETGPARSGGEAEQTVFDHFLDLVVAALLAAGSVNWRTVHRPNWPAFRTSNIYYLR